MKRYIILSCLLIVTAAGFSQQLQTSSLYDLQGVTFNPSLAGTGPEKGMVGASYRAQWSGISGSPKTATVFGSVDLPKHKFGLGGYLYNDKTGPTSRTGASISFAKHIVMKNQGKLSFGIETRFQQFAIDKAKLSASLGANDPVLAGSGNEFKFDAGFGISYTDNKWQIGAAVSQLVQSKLDFYNGNLTPAQEGRLYRHYYFHGKYKWDVDEATSISPNFLLTYLPNAPVEFQGGVRVEHNQLFWWGLGARARQGFLLSAGINIQKSFTVGYAFDIYRTPSSVFESGGNAHELLLRYSFSK